MRNGRRVSVRDTFRGSLDADDGDVRLSPRQREGRLAGARRDVEYLVARPCRERLEQGLTHRRELRQKEVKLFGDGVPVGMIVVSVHIASHGYSYCARHDGRCAVYLRWRHRIRRTRGRETDLLIHANCVTGKTHLSLAPRAWARVKLTSAAAR